MQKAHSALGEKVADISVNVCVCVCVSVYVYACVFVCIAMFVCVGRQGLTSSWAAEYHLEGMLALASFSCREKWVV